MYWRRDVTRSDRRAGTSPAHTVPRIMRNSICPQPGRGGPWGLPRAGTSPAPTAPRIMRNSICPHPGRGGPRGRPSGTTRAPLGCAPGRGMAPMLPRQRSRGQARNCGRTVCAPTKNVIRCGERNISAPTQHVVPIPRADKIRPYKKRESGVGNDSCPPHEKRKPDIVGGAYPHGPFPPP